MWQELGTVLKLMLSIIIVIRVFLENIVIYHMPVGDLIHYDSQQFMYDLETVIAIYAHV